MSRQDPLAWSQSYPNQPGHVHGSRTSQEAARRMKPAVSDLHNRVLAAFRLAGERGLTDNELQAAVYTQSVLRPRRVELTALGKIKASGRTRLTGSGRKAEVWVLA